MRLQAEAKRRGDMKPIEECVGKLEIKKTVRQNGQPFQTTWSGRRLKYVYVLIDSCEYIRPRCVCSYMQL